MSVPAIGARPLDAERQFESLRRVQAQIEAMTKAAGGGDEALPAWYAHLPSGVAFRIKSINTFGPFLNIVGVDDRTYLLLAPEAVAITIEPIPAEELETPRFKIGFSPPEPEE